MINLKTVYEQACKGTASGRGPSYWAIATSCGLRRRLMGAQAAAIEAGETSEAIRCGSFVHALMDALAQGMPVESLRTYDEAVQDCDWADALRITRFFTDYFPQDYFGTIVASEQKLPVHEQHIRAIEAYFGHSEVSGQIDRLVELSAQDCWRLERTFDVRLAGPGLYILDFKTSGQRWNSARAEAACNGMQALTYQVLWNLAGGVPVKGVIFLVLVKHRALSVEKSVQLFASLYRRDYPAIVRTGINQARQRRDEGRADPFACYSLFDACPFLQKGCARR